MIAVYILVAILTLMFMITIHELGHYIMGRVLGFKINEFAIGLGKPIFKWRSKKTGILYTIRMIPMGGYCAFEGEDDAGSPGQDKKKKCKNDSMPELASDGTLNAPKHDALANLRDDAGEITTTAKLSGAGVTPADYPEPSGLPFDKTHPWKRLVVLFSGAFFNLVSAVIFSFILLISLGYNHGVVISMQDEYGTPIQSHNSQVLNHGDVILEIDGVDFNWLRSMPGVIATHRVAPSSDGSASYSEPIPVLILRDGERISEYIRFRRSVNDQGQEVITLGVRMAGTQFVSLGFGRALGMAFVFTAELAWLMLTFLWMLLTGQMGLSGMAGPIGTVTVLTETVASNMMNLLLLLPLIAVNLGVFNLLPIPALDGARMVFVGIEWVRGKPIRPELEGRIHMIGLFLILGLVLIADINFIFGGGRGVLEMFGRWRL